VRGAEETANHKKRKNKGTKRPGRTNPAHGFIPARKGTFLFGEKYSLDRGPLMGTNLTLERFGGLTITGGKRGSNLADENRVLN